MKRIAILGSNGMLGREFSRQTPPDVQIIELNRKSTREFEKNSHFQLASDLSNIELILDTSKIDYVVNCAGLIRQKIVEKDINSRRLALESNFELPLNLVRLSERYNFKILQIGTDCVFSGKRGSYFEGDKHDASDLYGKSKSIGEIQHPNLSVLRASIIGIEKKSSSSLLSWLLTQDKNATINGYKDQLWNGVTIMHFAKVLYAAILNDGLKEEFQVQHLIPQDVVSKFQLLEISKKHFGRMDIHVEPVESGSPLDMSLATVNPGLNELMWKRAGYLHVPSVDEMIAEYAMTTNEVEQI